MQEKMMEIFVNTVVEGASDLMLVSGSPPIIRKSGRLIPMKNHFPLSSDECKNLLYSFLSDEQKTIFEKEWELDLSVSLEEISRFRVNLHYEKGNVGAAIRPISNEIRSVADLRLPRVVNDIANKESGLVLITGITGSGKSSTMAAIIDLINQKLRKHIITIEDPIEFLHENKQSIVEQRELGSDTKSFANALKHVLRQDPDVILIGEIRDLETTEITIKAAESGHLVFSTLHTGDAPRTVDRIIDMFPSDMQNQIRKQMSLVLEAVISQKLLPRKDGEGRALATEVMLGTPAVGNIIREGKTQELYMAIETGVDLGMHNMDSSLIELYRDGLITHETAVAHAHDVNALKRTLLSSITNPGEVIF